MKTHIQQLKNELAVDRLQVSVSAEELMNYCQDHAWEDVLITGFRGHHGKNPWQEKSSFPCVVM